MAVYGSQFIEGKVQDLRFASSAEYLFWTPRLNGKDVKPSAAACKIYDQDDTLLASSTNLTLCTVESEGWLGFKSLTARYNLGAVITAASGNTFTGTIRDVQYTTTTTGRLYLMDLYGSPTSGTLIADDGTTPGSATVDGTPYSATMYASVNLASTASYTVGENYRAQITWTYASVSRIDQVYFDIVYNPIRPMVSGRMIDDAHPDWRSQRPSELRDWAHAICMGHAELCRRIRALGNRASFIAKREELLPYELAFVEAEIARNQIGMDEELRDYWTGRADNLWNSRGEFVYSSSNDEGEVDANPKVFSSRLTR